MTMLGLLMLSVPSLPLSLVLVLVALAALVTLWCERPQYRRLFGLAVAVVIATVTPSAKTVICSYCWWCVECWLF